MNITRIKTVASNCVEQGKEMIIAQMVKDANIGITDNPEQADLFLVLGGDGFMLQTIHKYRRFRKPFLGLNFGTKGFLLNDKEGLADALVQQSFQPFEFPLLRFTCKTTAGQELTGFAINDVCIERMIQRAVKLQININDRAFIPNLQADGAIIASSLGSTAYNLAAGGAAIFPTLRAICLNAVAVHAPVQFKPFVLPMSDSVMVTVKEPETRPARLAHDGFQIDSIVWARITGSKETVRLLFWKHHNFITSLSEKILKAPHRSSN